ncbi:MAG: hypothetical protein IPH82_29185 [Chloroflexi bacterium]|nr:hypothetical protein [Chloroflexota bacterium]
MALLQSVVLDRRQVGEWAIAFLKTQSKFGDSLQRTFEAMSVLVSLGWPDMATRLTAALTICISAWETSQKDHRDPRSIAWNYVSLFVAYGKQNKTKRQQILQMVAPQVHQHGGLWPAIAIEICTLLKGVAYLDEWLQYLRDSTWHKAYPIIDTLGRLEVQPAVVERLVEKLDSPLAG